VNELATAVFAAQADAHLVDAPRSARFAAFRRTFDPASYLRELGARGYRWLGRSDPAFPPLLRAIHDPPPGLFVRGAAELELLARPAVAVVGARASSGYGLTVATTIGRDVAAAGVIVVSGLARGVDAAAHRGAFATTDGLRLYADPVTGGFIVAGQSTRVPQSNVSGVLVFLIVSAVPALMQALKDKEADVRETACEALGDIGAEAKTVVPVLADMLTKDPDLNVRCAAANALGDFKAEARSAIPALKEALKTKEPLVQDAVAGAIKKINDASRKIGS